MSLQNECGGKFLQGKYSRYRVIPILAAAIVIVSVLLLASISSTKKKVRVKPLVVQPDVVGAKVILCAILKNEELYIDEWLRYHQYLGFDAAYLHDNGDKPSPYLASLPQVYGDYVKVIRHEGANQQRAVYNNCTQNFKDKNTWAAFIDVDEFIVLRKHESIHKFLSDLAPKGGSVVLNWAYFSNNGVRTHQPGPVVSRFTYTTKELNQHVKTIAYLPHVFLADVHWTALLPGHSSVDVMGRPHKDNDPFLLNNAGHREVAYLNHYNSKSLEEFMSKRRRGRADMDLPIDSNAKIIAEFEPQDQGLKEIEDTFARDFYMRNYFGAEYDEIFKKNVPNVEA